MAFDDEKVVVVDLFMQRDAVVDRISIDDNVNSITVEGRMLNEKLGVYAMRIVLEENPSKSLYTIAPQYIFYDSKKRAFRGEFTQQVKILEDSRPKLVEIYLREKPESIKYGVVYSDRIKVEDLILGCRAPLEDFPHERMILEELSEIELEKKKAEADEIKKSDEKTKEREEKQRRDNKIDKYEYNQNGLEYVEEVEEEDEDDDSIDLNRKNKDSVLTKQTKQIVKKKLDETIKSKGSFSNASETDTIYNKQQGYEKEVEKLEDNIDALNRENEEIQSKIAIILDFRKLENRDDRAYYKEFNINQSTYTDSLTSAAKLYNELNQHRKKLNADLQKYQQSIKIQEERKKDVYKILMNYKEELISTAEYRKGNKIPESQIEEWLSDEKTYEDEIKQLRIENIKNTLELNRLNKELKKQEEYFEGLHLIDFEQLKIENNTLTEKIEDRNEEILKLKNKINENVQVLAHLQEKYTFINDDANKKKDEEGKYLKQLTDKKSHLTKKKNYVENKQNKNYQIKHKIDQINSESLKEYYTDTNKNIIGLTKQINSIFNQIYDSNKGDLKIIKVLQKRTKDLLRDFNTLPKLKEKSNNH